MIMLMLSTVAVGSVNPDHNDNDNVDGPGEQCSPNMSEEKNQFQVYIKDKFLLLFKPGY